VNTHRFTLPGHASLLDSLARVLSETAPNRHVGVLVLHVRDHRRIRMERGHEAAEAFFEALAQRVFGVLKEGDLIERIDAGRLALVLPALSSPSQAELAAAGILKAFRTPLVWGDGQLVVRVRIGIATAGAKSEKAGEVLRRAELALWHATQNPDGYVRYAPGIDRQSLQVDNHVLERELEGAIDRDELSVRLQPKVCLASGQVSGAEALLRWTRADGEAVSPERFIPIAERSGLIVPITLWTLNAALRACSGWLTERDGFSVAVNLSPVALNDPDIATLIADAAGIWCPDPASLVLEITESAISSDPAAAMRALQTLLDNGIRLSIDDFGTGYTSLSQLGVLSASELKIDRSFVSGVTRTKRNGVIVRSVVDLAHNFGMSVVAEGIEEREEFRFLAALGCDYGQGYYISRPLEVEHFERWLDGQDAAAEVDAAVA
jgi:EAL domain-containing protein (putative c-di-GMP-specific phosphodiesterase class I)/GGDEF domain-containing protein